MRAMLNEAESMTSPSSRDAILSLVTFCYMFVLLVSLWVLQFPLTSQKHVGKWIGDSSFPLDVNECLWCCVMDWSSIHTCLVQQIHHDPDQDKSGS